LIGRLFAGLGLHLDKGYPALWQYTDDVSNTLHVVGVTDVHTELVVVGMGFVTEAEHTFRA
jgi:hypothetical protein